MGEEHAKKIQSLHDAPLHSFLGFIPGECGKGYGEVRIRITENHLNASGFVHGGVFSALCEIGASYAFTTLIDENTFFVTNDISMSVLGPASSGELIARGNVLKMGKRLAFVECKISDQNDNLLAVGRITKSILPKPTP
jgi:uncharacterized protein (TIGR00369 family)